MPCSTSPSASTPGGCTVDAAAPSSLAETVALLEALGDVPRQRYGTDLSLECTRLRGECRLRHVRRSAAWVTPLGPTATSDQKAPMARSGHHLTSAGCVVAGAASPTVTAVHRP